APVLSRISRAAVSRSAFVRLHMATLAPSSASTSAQARPSPLLAPPTMATRSFSSRSMCSLRLSYIEGDAVVDHASDESIARGQLARELFTGAHRHVEG